MTEEQRQFLLEYECPAFADYVSINWMQEIIARYLAWKIKRKYRRYRQVMLRKAFIKSFEDPLNQ